MNGWISSDYLQGNLDFLLNILPIEFQKLKLSNRKGHILSGWIVVILAWTI